MPALRVSCIVPVFDGEAYLAPALASILGQSEPPFEVIVVDDGSRDGSPEIVARHGGRVTYTRQEHAGQAAARNRGLALAAGDLIAFLDHDDLWHPAKLARQTARFAARPELDLCFAHAVNFWTPELAGAAAAPGGDPRLAPLPFFSLGTMLARRPVFTRVGGFTPEIRHGEDLDWLLRANEAGLATELLADVLLYRRLHRTNHSWRVVGPGARERAALLPVVKASLDRRRQGGAPVAPYRWPAAVSPGPGAAASPPGGPVAPGPGATS